MLTNDNILQIRNLTKKYGNFEALKNINLSFENGVYGLLGHNGAGKTTLLNCISGILDYDGEITYNGKDIHDKDLRFKEILGVVPQQQTLDLPITVENFLYYISSLKGLKNYKGKIKQLLIELELEEHKNKKLASISGGMKQRLLIAQCLLNDPKIVLLDEPTAGLDPVQRRNLRDILAVISKDRIVILATHVINDIELIANNIVFMKSGNVLNFDTQDNLLSEIKVYETSQDIDDLISKDSTIKVVNTKNVNGALWTRFISEKDYPNRVHTSMDDVYLEWLG